MTYSSFKATLPATGVKALDNTEVLTARKITV